MNEQNQMAANSAPVEQKKKSFVWVFILGGLAAVVAVVLGVGVYKVYAKTSVDRFSLVIAKALRLPAIKVGKEKILYTAYAEDLEAIHIMRNFDKAQRDAGASPDKSPGADLAEEQMSDQVLWRLVNNLLVERAAKKYSIIIEDKDIENLKQQMMLQFKDENAANEELKKRYGWTMAVYEQKVMRPFVLQTKLAQKLKDDARIKEDLRTQAQQVLQEVKNGADFAALAKQYAADSTGERGGDVGWFSRGEMVPEFERAAFSLKKGEIYPTLVETVYGFHIIRLDDKKTEKVKDDKGKMVSVEKARASQILFRFVDLMGYIEKAVKEEKINLYLKVRNPFVELQSSSTTQK